jgi:hypothetical protein
LGMSQRAKRNYQQQCHGSSDKNFLDSLHMV